MTFWEFFGITISSAGLFASILGAFLTYAARKNGEATRELIRGMQAETQALIRSMQEENQDLIRGMQRETQTLIRSMEEHLAKQNSLMEERLQRLLERTE